MSIKNHLLISLFVVLSSLTTYSATTYTVTSNANGTPTDGVSLRWAITEANANPGADNIVFNISVSYTISLSSALPVITSTVKIDGTTQPGYAGKPLITLAGNGLSGGLSIASTAAASEIKGLFLQGFGSSGAIIITAYDVVISSNVISNSTHGVVINASNAAPSGIKIRNNKLGTDRDGEAIFGVNGGNGVYIFNGHGIEIGGSGIGEGNLISGWSSGIYINISSGSGVLVKGNKIGTDIDGTNSLPNFIGVYVEYGVNNIIGGSLPGEGNLISGNHAHGVYMRLGGNNTVKGNLIGTDITGTLPLPNGLGFATGAGIYLLSSGNFIGGTNDGEGNIIAYDSIRGINVGGTDVADNNLLSGNRIYGITKGIELNYGSLFPGNENKQPPVITSGYYGTGNASVSGTTTGATDLIELFLSDIGGINANEYLGKTTAIGGAWSIKGLTLVNGYTVVATATDVNNNTSELSSPSRFWIEISPDATICLGQSTQISASGGDNYSWQPATSLNNATVFNPIASPLETTTYTVTVSTGTLVGTAEVTITVNSLPSVAVTPASISICTNGTSTSVTLTASGANSYTWMPETFLSASAGASVVSTPSVNITYTVTGTGANGCTNTATSSISVSYIPSVTVSPSNTSICIGGSTSLTANGANTYNWSPSSGLNTITGAIVIAGPSVTTTYTITGTTNEGCSSNAFSTVTIDPSCCSASVNYFNDTISSATTHTGITVAISGTLTISSGVPFTIDNCTVLMGKDAIINVMGTFTITNTSHLYACGDLWNGIQVQSTGALTVNGNSSIEDALNAIVSVGGGYYSLNSAKLNKNFKHIVVQPFAFHHPATMQSTDLTCTSSATSPGNTLKAPKTGERTSIGMEINTVSTMTIGVAGSGLGNTFDNMSQYGILANRIDTLEIYNNTFTKIPNTAPYIIGAPAAIKVNGVDNGTGFNYSVLKVGSATAFSGNTIDTCANGIIADSCISYVEYNTIANIVSTGIYIRNVIAFVSSALIINNNTITDMKTGIWIYNIGTFHNTLNPKMHIDDNDLDLDNRTLGIGMKIENNSIPFGINSPFFIERNDIIQAQTGINAIDKQELTIAENHIELKSVASNTYARGIYLQNSTVNRVSENTVHGLSTTNTDIQGIRMDLGGTSTIFDCNTVDTLGVGLVFVGSNLDTRLIRNIMYTNQAGLVLASSGIIGDQGAINEPYDNEWQGTFTAHTYTTFGTDGRLSNLYVQSGLPYEPTINSARTSDGSIAIPHTVTSSTITLDCPYVEEEGFGKKENESGDRYKQSRLAQALVIINDSTLFTGEYGEGNKWWSRYHLYQSLQQDRAFLESDSGLIKFRDEYEISSAGKLSALRQSMPAYKSNEQLRAARAENAGIATSNPIEENLQAMYQLFLSQKLEKRDSLNAEEMDLLNELARLCPITEGPAVYAARVLLAQIDTVPVHYESECEKIILDLGSRKTDNAAVAAFEEDAISVYPNPAAHELNIQVKINEGETGYLDIYHLTGEKISNYQLVTGNTVISTTGLSSGIYFYRISINNEVKQTNKLVIIK